MKVKWKFPMKYNFFCDENITIKLQNVIKKFVYPVDSVRNQRLFGISNGTLLKHLNDHNLTLITFDKVFLEMEFFVNQGVIILDINPNRKVNPRMVSSDSICPSVEHFSNYARTLLIYSYYLKF